MSKIVDSHHSIYYSIPFAPTPRQAADSLLGLEKVVRLVPATLLPLGLAPDARIEIYVDSVQAGSLKDNFKVRFVWGDEEKFNRWMTRVRQITGIEQMTNRLPILGPALALLVVSGLGYGALRMMGRSGAGNGNIQDLQNLQSSIVNTGTIVFGCDEATVLSALEKGGGNVFNLASNAVKFVSPAKNTQTSITIDEDERLVIPPAAIAAAPYHVDRSSGELRTIRRTNETIVVRALDLDKQKGWGVTVPALTGRRLPAEITPDLVGGGIPAGEAISADIELKYVENDDGDRFYKTVKILAYPSASSN
jgi:hypothetical protein